MRLRRLALAALITRVAGDAHAQALSGTVDITVSVQSSDSAHVEEHYELASALSPLQLRVLTRPCAAIVNLAFERGGVAVAMVESRQGPWLTYRDTALSRGDSRRLSVRYDVQLTGTGAIPLVHPASALAKSDTSRLGAISVGVRFAAGPGRVVFPHMTRQAPDEWSARYVAVPSFVEVSGIELTRCDEVVGERGDNGGLVWRFFLLVGIMVAWVPLYLAWARRSGDSA